MFCKSYSMSIRSHCISGGPSSAFPKATDPTLEGSTLLITSQRPALLSFDIWDIPT